MNYKLISVIELSEQLGVPPSWVYARTRIKGPESIPCIRVGKYCKFQIEKVMEWLEKRNKRGLDH